MYDLTLITPTRDRPECMELAEEWLIRQDYEGHLQWIIVSDGDQGFMHPFEKCVTHEGLLKIDAQVVTRPPSDEGRTSLPSNLLHVLDRVDADRVVIWEDDEWYRRDYLRWCEAALSGGDIAGEVVAAYYHLPARRWEEAEVWNQASLARTCFWSDALPAFKRCCEAAKAAGEPFVDLYFWGLRGNVEGVDKLRKLPYWRRPPGAVGMKGLPGRAGLGARHNPNSVKNQDDENLTKLREWIGDEDANVYADLMKVAK